MFEAAVQLRRDLLMFEAAVQLRRHLLIFEATVLLRQHLLITEATIQLRRHLLVTEASFICHILFWYYKWFNEGVRYSDGSLLETTASLEDKV